MQVDQVLARHCMGHYVGAIVESNVPSTPRLNLVQEHSQGTPLEAITLVRKHSQGTPLDAIAKCPRSQTVRHHILLS